MNHGGRSSEMRKKIRATKRKRDQEDTMKKHLLRIFTVLLLACLGIGVLAACGDRVEKDPADTYTVEFNLGDPNHAATGVTAPAKQTGKKVGDTITLTALDAAENWKFDGWHTKNGKVNGTTYTVKAADAVEGTITLTAHWADDTPAPAVYTVTYALGEHAASGAEVPSQATANEGNSYTVTLPAAPAAAQGWAFEGWDVGGQVKQPDDEITVSDNITVTAKWAEDMSTVTGYDGIWTLEDGGAKTEVTLKLAADKATAEAIIYTFEPADPGDTKAMDTHTIHYYTLASTDNGYYVKDHSTSYTFLMDGGALKMTKTAPNPNGFGRDVTTETTFAAAARADLPAAAPTAPADLRKAGLRQYNDEGELETVATLVDFEKRIVTVRTNDYKFTVTPFANYLLLNATLDEEVAEDEDPTTATFFVYKNADKYYILGGGEYMEPSELQTGTFQKYTISFTLGAHAASDATVPQAITAVEGSNVVLPAGPKAEDGYRFNFWEEVTSADNKGHWNAGKKINVTKDIQLKGIYEQIIYYLTFDKNPPAGVQASDIRTVFGAFPVRSDFDKVGDTLALPELQPLDGYIFKGWKWSASESVVRTFTLTAEVIEALGDAMNIKLSAVWEPIPADQFAITFSSGNRLDDSDLNTIAGMPTNTTAAAGAFSIPAEEPTCEGYTFLGWKAKVTGETDTNTYKYGGDHPTYTVTNKSVIFEAMWQKAKYTVTYDFGEGSADTKANEEYEWGAEVPFPAQPPTAKPGYKFSKWEAKANGEGDALDGHRLNCFTMPKSNVTVYATWTKVYTVKFDLGENAAADASVADVADKAVGAKVTLSTPKAAEGWEFDGWYTKNGKVEGDEYTVLLADLDAADGYIITLTAHWKQATDKGIDDYVGTWSYSDGVGEHSVLIAKDAAGTGLHAVLRTRGRSVKFDDYCKLTASAEGYGTEASANHAKVTVTLEGGKLSVKIGDAAATQYSKGTDDESFTLSGTYKMKTNTTVIDFDGKTIDGASFDNNEIIAVQGILLFSAQYNGEAHTFVVFKMGANYCVFIIGGNSQIMLEQQS